MHCVALLLFRQAACFAASPVGFFTYHASGTWTISSPQSTHWQRSLLWTAWPGGLVCETLRCSGHISVEHFRLVRACLGSTAVAKHKLEAGNPLIVLGVQVLVLEDGLTFWPAPGKVEKWSTRISEALRTGKMSPGEASKLSGALQWGTQFVFKKLGRAMTRPIFRKAHQHFPELDDEMLLALRWWREVLHLGIKYVQRPFHRWHGSGV